MNKRKPKKDQFRFEYVIDESQEIIFEDYKGNKIKEKITSEKPSDKKKAKNIVTFNKISTANKNKKTTKK